MAQEEVNSDSWPTALRNVLSPSCSTSFGLRHGRPRPLDHTPNGTISYGCKNLIRAGDSWRHLAPASLLSAILKSLALSGKNYSCYATARKCQ